MRIFSTLALLTVMLFISAACTLKNPETQRSDTKGWYRVKSGDTLHSIAWRYDLDYQAIAHWNKIDVNAVIYPGQRLLLIEPTPSVSTATNKTTVSPVIQQPELIWVWPTTGKLVSTFLTGQLDRQGINIAGEKGQAIRAAADGRVVYSGNNLAGYGNLIIIKHSHTYLSAYAYNQQRLVTEGTTVKSGDLIARMGRHKTKTAQLHFQIRKHGKPVNPIQYLPKRQAS